MLKDITMYVWWIMRLLVNNFDNVRIFKDRSLFGLPRWIIECTDPDFGFRNEIVLSGIWYKHEQVLKIAMQKNKEYK
jgi:hypothetical protein